jgi:acid phosphatase
MADGNYYAVNTTQPPYQPSGTAPSPRGDQRLADSAGNGSDAAIPLPPQTLRTVGDTLSAKNVGWRWYAGGYYQAQADRAAIYNGTVPNFQPHHQPFNYFSRFDPATTAGAAERAAHFRDYADLVNDIGAGTLPPVAFYKPQGNLNQHPGYADVASGDAHVADLVAKLQAGPQWKNMLVIVTYDENGGLWDHAPPPRADAWGPGTRVPAIILSPFAKKGYVDSVPYDTTSVIRFLTRRFGLDPLPGARRDMGDLSNALDLIP